MYCTENKHFDSTIRSSYAFHQKEGMTKKITFFTKKCPKDLVIQKKVVPLHRNRER